MSEPKASELKAIFDAHTGPVIRKWTPYFEAYERHLSRYRNRPAKMLEIGVGSGGALQMWRRYFGQDMTLVAVDISESFANRGRAAGADIRIGDQSDTAFLDEVIKEFGTFDIVIDDGSHIMEHMRASFDFLYPKLAVDGVYIVEDMHTCYWSRFGGGYRKGDTFMEYAKGLCDELFAFHSRDRESFKVTAFTESTKSVCFYDSMVVFERKKRTVEDVHAIFAPPRET